MSRLLGGDLVGGAMTVNCLLYVLREEGTDYHKTLSPFSLPGRMLRSKQQMV